MISTQTIAQRRLGRTGFTVSEIGFGAWAIGGNAHGNSYGPTDDEESVRALERAIDLGCTFIDTADVYGFGRSEELIGQVAGRLQGVVVATKVGGDFYSRLDQVTLNFAPGYIRQACERSLKRLRREAIDLYLLHNPPLRIVGDDRLYETLEILREEGKIRAYGVSIHDPAEGMAALRTGRPAAIEVVVNLLHRPATELLELAAELDVAIIAREPLANGFLAGKIEPWYRWDHGDIRHRWPAAVVAERCRQIERYRHLECEGRTLAQAAISYPLALPQVSTVIPGCKTVRQVEENLGAAWALPLTPEDTYGLHARPAAT